MKRRIFPALCALCLACGVASAQGTAPQRKTPQRAAPQRAVPQRERILDYHSDIDVGENGEMRVHETIRVYSMGQQIRHGIYRDFPTHYRDRIGNSYVVGFHFLSALRDGAQETWRVEDVSNGERVYLGNSNAMLPTGMHLYELDYSTDRQLGFFRDHDELFWNATGNGWAFPIDRASANVRLPEKIPADDVTLSGYTGQQGSMDQDLTTSTSPEGAFSFEANRPLPPFEGLTVLLKWPKGYIAAPTTYKKFQYFVHDNLGAVCLLAGLLLALAYYLAAWMIVGDDSSQRVIMPIYDPPDGFSPAAMRYLVRMGYDNKVLTAAILDMAVKGYVRISEQSGTYSLDRTANGNVKLSADESIVADNLLDEGSSTLLRRENHVAIARSIAALKAGLKVAEEKTYFVTNSKYMIPAVVITSLGLLGLIANIHPPQKISLAAFLCSWLTIWSIGVWAMFSAAGHLWISAFQGGHLRAALMGRAFLQSLAMFPFLLGEIFGIVMLALVASPVVVVALIATVALHVVFHQLLKRPTSAGRSALDKIAGFKMFLSAVEGDRLNRVFPPEKTPEVFEKFLPYALALDVEQQWSEKFAGVIDGASRVPGSNSGAYSPVWYSGADWNSFGAAGFASSFSGSFSGAISSSSTAPGSAGGGGGGSGGGGGGGGGGGW
jgi:uncharacterized membrane protein YgcG